MVTPKKTAHRVPPTADSSGDEAKFVGRCNSIIDPSSLAPLFLQAISLYGSKQSSLNSTFKHA